MQMEINGKTMDVPDPEENWAEVELYRWQYGRLPIEGKEEPLDASKGFEAMADAIAEGCKSGDTSKMPNPFNVMMALRYAAKKLKQ